MGVGGVQAQPDLAGNENICFFKEFLRMCTSPEFQTFRRPWYGLESATDSATQDIIMCAHGKGGLISESFSFLSSKVPNHYPEHYPHK